MTNNWAIFAGAIDREINAARRRRDLPHARALTDIGKWVRDESLGKPLDYPAMCAAAEKSLAELTRAGENLKAEHTPAFRAHRRQIRALSIELDGYRIMNENLRKYAAQYRKDDHAPQQSNG